MCLSAYGVYAVISTHTLTWSVTYVDDYNVEFLSISTHTLTWSVTEVAENSYIHMEISTHTLTWSVTLLVLEGFSMFLNFNSHAHVERDKTTLTKLVYKIYFNSHAHVERDANF